MENVVYAARTPNGWTTEVDYRIDFVPTEKRLRVTFGGETVADSRNARILRETRHHAVYYFPMADVRMDLLQPTDHSTHCPHKGDASYWTVTAGDKSAENAAWSYRAPFPHLDAIKDYVAFYWNKMDGWWEEAEEIRIHPRDPHVRIDILQSDRHVQVVVGGKTVAETRRPLMLFETGLPARYYIPPEDVRVDMLSRTGGQTSCPYKGDAIYWMVVHDNGYVEDAVWAYPDPFAEVGRITDHYSFYPDKVDALIVDGETVAGTRTA